MREESTQGQVILPFSSPHKNLIQDNVMLVDIQTAAEHRIASLRIEGLSASRFQSDQAKKKGEPGGSPLKRSGIELEFQDDTKLNYASSQ